MIQTISDAVSQSVNQPQSNISPASFVQFIRRFAFRAIRTVYKLCNTFFGATFVGFRTHVTRRSRSKLSPFLRNIRVADAWDRMCPPMGCAADERLNELRFRCVGLVTFNAPPATKVMVAPGSAAQTQLSIRHGRGKVDIQTLNLIRKEDCHLKIQ